MEYKHKLGVMNFHDTPWNSRILAGKTFEIDDILTTQLNSADELVRSFCIFAKKEKYVLGSCRIKGDDNPTKRALFLNDFRIIEHTLDVVVNKLDIDKLTQLSLRFPVIVDDYKLDDIDSIKDIAVNEFCFGRFFEDPLISLNIAKNRNLFWIEDLIAQASKIAVLRKKSKTVGFIVYKESDGIVELILGGVSKNYRFLSYGFWSRFLLDIPNPKMIKTLISSSNIDVMNLYLYLGFRFENPRFGFHKHF